MITELYILDRLINKHIKLKVSKPLETLAYGQKVLYTLSDDPDKKISLWINVGYTVPTEKDGIFLDVLAGSKKEKFDEYQKKALSLFPLFKKEFKKLFTPVIPVTARSNYQGNQIYFYFYSEQRFVFSEFVKSFRNKIGIHFFLFQVGARDMMRLSPTNHIDLAACGCGPLGCSSLGPLPSVEMENIALQWLEGKDIEKLKGRCGKLKCSIIYEKDLYLEESKKYPYKWQEVKTSDWCMKCGGYNIMTWEVILYDQHNHLNKKNLSEITFTPTIS